MKINNDDISTFINTIKWKEKDAKEFLKLVPNKWEEHIRHIYRAQGVEGTSIPFLNAPAKFFIELLKKNANIACWILYEYTMNSDRIGSMPINEKEERRFWVNLVDQAKKINVEKLVEAIANIKSTTFLMDIKRRDSEKVAKFVLEHYSEGDFKRIFIAFMIGSGYEEFKL